jgi:nucleoprotein TPR
VDRVEQKNAELAEKNATVQSYLAKVVSASEERSRVEGALREANGRANAFDAAKARMEQEATLLQQHNEWLRAELQRKSEELLSSRKAASAEALAGAEALEKAKREAASAQRELAASKEAQIAAEAAALKRAQELKAAREAAAAAEAHFDKELVTSKRLAELYKTQAEGRGGKTEELEGVLQALRDHLRELKEEHARELAAEKKGRAEAEKALVEAKLNFDGRVAAAAGRRRRERERASLRDAQRGRRVGPRRRRRAHGRRFAGDAAAGRVRGGAAPGESEHD